ncbi:MAG: PKD domain-containing protein [Saprospiraceae bacterium]|nr:PKD domain-containing protein [Saprospiraceae bacterium]
MRLLYVFLLLSVSYISNAQCIADFFVTSENSTFQFTDASILSEGETITSRLWRFGDGSTSTQENPVHTYVSPGSYNAILQIATSEGCNASDTLLIEICSIGLDFNLGTVCNAQGNVSLTLTVTDVFNSLQFINVFLDDILVNDTAIAIPQGTLNLNLMVPGDGNQHFVMVESALTGQCNETIGFFVEDCNSSCFLSNLEIDETVNESHNIVITETGFIPNNRIIQLGDLVRFIWLDDNHSSTSVDTVSTDKWDSGVQDSSFTYELALKIPGIKPYYSTPDGPPDSGDFTGNIIANCPNSQSSRVELTFFNAFIPETGFYIGLDGVVLKDTVYDYSNNGLTKVEFSLPGDGKSHQMSIVDVADPSCALSSTVRAINCQGELNCALNVNAFIAERCDQDSMVQLAVGVSSLKPTDLGVAIMLDDTLAMDTIFFDGNQASTIISVFGDGLTHKISAMDLSDSLCTDELLIEINDCAEPCSISDLTVGTGSNNTIVLGVTNDKISLKDIIVASGDDILWQWVEDSIVGLRSIALSGPDSWDSGLQTNGAIFISPILTAGIHPYYMYNSAGDTLFQASIEVVANCEENMIPVFYSFDDVNGSFLGYDIFVDGVKISNGPFEYALDGDNKGVFQLEGDDLEHQIEIKDAEDNGCTADVTFVAPICEITPCGGMIELFVQDSCYNDNTIRYVAKVSHPNPSPQGFILEVNGELFQGFPFFYDANGEAFFEGSLPADSSVHLFSYMDLFDPNCFDTLSYQSPVCVTDCTLDLISAELITEDYQANNPMIPDSLVGCIDSFIHVEILFSETYSNGNNYFVFLDSFLVGDIYTYENGDTVNSFIISILGDEQPHLIQVFDGLDSACNFSTVITPPLCYSPCDILIDELSVDSCVNETAFYTLELDTTTNSIGYQVYYDGDSLEVTIDSFSIHFSAKADGLEHSILIVDNLEPLCQDSIDFTAAYCLNCPIDITLIQLDSCIIGDSIGYAFVFDDGLDSLDVQVSSLDSSWIINPQDIDYAYEIRLRGDSSAFEYVFTSLEDQFCSDTVFIQTIDCTPIICDPNFTFEIDGLTLTLSDSSTTSEPITSQSWTINGIVSIDDLSTFNFTVDSIGTYNICHQITTDSCSSELCLDVIVGDPCTLITPLFSVEMINDGFQFTNESTGNIDEYLYRFGDGIFSTNPNPFHIYDESGTYEACLVVKQDEFNCELEFCDSIVVVISNTNQVIESTFSVYPNPISENINELFIEYGGIHELQASSVQIVNSVGTQLPISSLTKTKNEVYSLQFNDTLTKGLYFIIIKDGNRRISRKLIVI